LQDFIPTRANEEYEPSVKAQIMQIQNWGGGEGGNSCEDQFWSENQLGPLFLFLLHYFSIPTFDVILSSCKTAAQYPNLG